MILKSVWGHMPSASLLLKVISQDNQDFQCYKPDEAGLAAGNVSPVILIGFLCIISFQIGIREFCANGLKVMACYDTALLP